MERLKNDKENGSADNNSKVNFYMKQTGTLDNACGIIASLHACLNNLDGINLKADSILDKFYTANKDASPEDRAKNLEEAKEFQEEHKEFAA